MEKIDVRIHNPETQYEIRRQIIWLRKQGVKNTVVAAGEGSQLNICKTIAGRAPGESVIFHSPWLEEETSEILCSADVLVLPTRGNQSMVSVPSKLISYMLAGRPVIAMALAQSDLAKIIDKSGCGWLVEPDDSEMLASKIREILAMAPDELKRRGEAGRKFALANFTREVCLPNVISIIEQATYHDQ